MRLSEYALTIQRIAEDSRLQSTKAILKRGLKPLEKTPSGASAGPSERGKTRSGGIYGHIDFEPPAKVASEAKKGLDLRKWNETRKKLPSSDPASLGASASLGGTSIGVARALQLSKRRPVSPRDIRRMVNYFTRHAKDVEAENFGNDKTPSPGYVAWLLWGGDSGFSWAKRVLDQMLKAEQPK
jgi:hypothetical protein